MKIICINLVVFPLTKYQDIEDIRKQVLFEQHRNKQDIRKIVCSAAFAYDETSTMMTRSHFR
jgi:hypothetical protein